MCGRFVGFRRLEQLKEYFPIDETNWGNPNIRVTSRHPETMIINSM
jgi:hypothetical protein